jgi:hypothetical protein
MISNDTLVLPDGVVAFLPGRAGSRWRHRVERPEVTRIRTRSSPRPEPAGEFVAQAAEPLV